MPVVYCKRCGRVIIRDWYNKYEACDCCSGRMYDVPSKYLYYDEEDEEFYDFLRDGAKEEIIEELVKPSPEFNQYHFDHREERIAKIHADYEAMMARGRAIIEEEKRRAKCPSCGSTNISKIGTLDRMLSVGIFGLASSKIGKTHKCNHCGATW